MEFIMDSPPGICSQEDYNHDFNLLVECLKKETGGSLRNKYNIHAYFLVKLAVTKGYKIPW